MRLFLALEVATAIREALANVAANFQSEAPGARWSKPESMHLTLKFLGQSDTHKVESIRATLAKITCAQPISLQFRGVGFFPDQKRPRVMWCGIEATPNLFDLVTSIENSLACFGFETQAPAFTPHVTVARLNSAHNLTKLVRAAAPLKSYDFGAARESEFHLFESVLKPSGSEYRKLITFPFVKDEQ
jgi:RNA 2',3'-cyclic 3'-phosphodiesterase